MKRSARRAGKHALLRTDERSTAREVMRAHLGKDFVEEYFRRDAGWIRPMGRGQDPGHPSRVHGSVADGGRTGGLRRTGLLRGLNGSAVRGKEFDESRVSPRSRQQRRHSNSRGLHRMRLR